MTKIYDMLKETGMAVEKRGQSFLIHKTFGSKPVTVALKKVAGKSGYEIWPVTYLFKNSLSFYDYSKKENRYTRNKTVIFSILKKLQKVGALNFINNRLKYLVVNKVKKLSVKKQGKAIDDLSVLRCA